MQSIPVPAACPSLQLEHSCPSVSHICHRRRPGLPAAGVRAVSAGASQAAPGSSEKSLAAGICPRGQSCGAPCSAAAALAGEGGEAQPAAHPAGGHTGHRHPPPASTGGGGGKLFHQRFHRGVSRMSSCGSYCARGVAVQVPVPHGQFTRPFVTPSFRGTISQCSVKGPLPRWFRSLPFSTGSRREVQGSQQHLQEPGKGQGVRAGVKTRPSVPLCCSCSLGQHLPPCPAPGAPQQSQIPQVLLEQEHNRKGCRALSTADICSSRDSETKDPADKGTPSPHGRGC